MDPEEKVSELSDCLELLNTILEKIESIREAKHLYDRLERDYSKMEEIIEELQDHGEDEDFKY